jgi:hypothetical protein
MACARLAHCVQKRRVEMLKSCCRGLAALGLVAGMCFSAAAANQETPSSRPASGAAAGPSPYAMPNCKVNWSHAYELTPAEHKRLRAKGLTDQEVFVVANAARLSGRDVDWLVQAVYRGERPNRMSALLNVPISEVTAVNPLWTTPGWEQAVEEGCPYYPASRAAP